MRKHRVIFSGTSSDGVYQVGEQGSDWRDDRQRAWRCLRWALLLSAVLLVLGIVIYFLLIDLQVEAPLVTTARESLFDGNLLPEDDVVALDGDVILDLGGVTYRVTPGQTTWPHHNPELNSQGSNESFSQDFIEIVQAPNLGTTSATDPDVTLPSSFLQTSDLDIHESQGIPIRNNQNRIVVVSDVRHNEEEEIMMTSDLEIGHKLTGGHRKYQMTNAHSRQPVHPTLPSNILKQAKEILGNPFVALNETESTCFSPRLEMCKGVLPYDLTTLPLVPGITSLSDLDAALPYFEMILQSGCSKRARQFICSLLEPACQPMGDSILPPCRKACKAVAEDCSDFMLATLDLSKVFHCSLYPDNNDPALCVNFAKGDECLSDEFRCPDGTCIPRRWECDSVSDCPLGADEVNCTQCLDQEFRCAIDNKCIPARWSCDGNNDCSDGSDETHCPSQVASGQPHTSPCPIGELRCLDGRCITMQQLCNGAHDCSDGADEANCGPN